MSGLTDLNSLLSSLDPQLADGEFVFLTREVSDIGETEKLNPIATFREREGLTLVVARSAAEDAKLEFEGVFRMITLQVLSSLKAVGLTAAVAGKLAEQGISANVIAAFHHDHVFVPSDRAAEAMSALMELQTEKPRPA